MSRPMQHSYPGFVCNGQALSVMDVVLQPNSLPGSAPRCDSTQKQRQPAPAQGSPNASQTLRAHQPPGESCQRERPRLRQTLDRACAVSCTTAARFERSAPAALAARPETAATAFDVVRPTHSADNVPCTSMSATVICSRVQGSISTVPSTICNQELGKTPMQLTLASAGLRVNPQLPSSDDGRTGNRA